MSVVIFGNPWNKMRILKRLTGRLFFFIVIICLLTGSVIPPADPTERVRAYTRDLEFDFVSWELDALMIKQKQAALNLPQYMKEDDQKITVRDCLKRVDEIQTINQAIEQVYSLPDAVSLASDLSRLKLQLDALNALQDRLAPVCESILQNQLNATLSGMGFTWGGQAIPPVLYHVTPLPYALIISPRSVIRQDANISLRTDLTLPEMVALEQKVESGLNVSALVVPIGGIGVYPTMVLSTSNLQNLVETVAHEWIHNYLTLRPLGLSYEKNADTRTMNETTASIAETEIALNLLKQFYPEDIPQPSPQTPGNGSTPDTLPAKPVFDFNQEMHETRVTADALLASGKITEAESYLESRRQLFLKNGYQIRRLNQAYFAFYGAYASEPGGSAGQDPVGPAVRALRDQSRSLVEFVNRISWMTSLEELQKAVGPVS